MIDLIPAVTQPVDENIDISEIIDDLNYEEASILLSELEGYRAPLVDIDQFVDDPNYLGNILKEKIYPPWRTVLREIFPNPYESPFFEIGLTGGIGLGKTTIARIILSYDIYKLLMLSDPYKKFDFIESDLIVIALFSATLELSDIVLYQPFRELMKISPFFKARMIYNVNKPDAGPIRFMGKIQIIAGSRFTHALGLGVFSGFLDEANFQGAVANQAYDSYTNLSRRMESRFMQIGGIIPGHLVLVSSKKDQNAFLEEHIEKMAKTPGFKAYSYPLWEMHKHKGIYSGVTFPMFTGNTVSSPKILVEEEVPHYPDNVINIPIEFKDKFITDPNGSLRDIAGLATASKGKFISYPEAIGKSVKIVNASKDEYIYVIFDDESKIIDLINTNILALYLRENDMSERFVHLDLGLTGDAAGFAMSSCCGYKEVQRMAAKTHMGDEIHEEAASFMTISEPIIRTELVMGIKSPTKVPIFKIRDFIHDLCDLGFPITTVTADSYESADTLQIMERAGFKVKIISVDRDKKAHYVFRNSLYEGRAEIPDHPILIKELGDLVDTGKKFDHPTVGTKDLSDATVGSHYMCFKENHGSMEFIEDDRPLILKVNPNSRGY